MQNWDLAFKVNSNEEFVYSTAAAVALCRKWKCQYTIVEYTTRKNVVLSISFTWGGVQKYTS
jgi:hypothetical protein